MHPVSGFATACYHRMASTYTKVDSPWIWIRFKSADGKWKGKPTEYRKANIGDRRQAKLMARKMTEVELATKSSAGNVGRRFSDWVIPWINDTYGASKNSTPAVYKRHWRALEQFLKARGVDQAVHITRELIGQYLAWRTETAGRNKTAGRNTAIGEIKFLSMVIREAINRGHRTDNPLAKPGLRKEPSPEKLIWSDEKLAVAAAHLAKHGSLWMRTAFYFGLYQACRLRQCQIPLEGIRFDLLKIIYPAELVKGRQGYSQPMDPRFRPILEGLVAEARALNWTHICVVPWDASIRLRRTFDRAGLQGFVHHGLRHTWITRAAHAGVPESHAMAFCHHENAEVHRVYKRLSVIGIEHVPSSVALPTFSQTAPAPSGPRGRAARPSDGGQKSGVRTQKRSPRPQTAG